MKNNHRIIGGGDIKFMPFLWPAHPPLFWLGLEYVKLDRIEAWLLDGINWGWGWLCKWGDLLLLRDEDLIDLFCITLWSTGKCWVGIAGVEALWIKGCCLLPWSMTTTFIWLDLDLLDSYLWWCWIGLIWTCCPNCSSKYGLYPLLTTDTSRGWSCSFERLRWCWPGTVNEWFSFSMIVRSSILWTG